MGEEIVRVFDSPDANRSWRRISTGKLSFLYSEENILPNYLRSPTGSCHDVCKYGSKHEHKDKSSVSPLKRVNRSFSGTSNSVKKTLTKSVLNPSFSCGKDNSLGSDLENIEVKRKKKTIGVKRGNALSRSKEMAEHNKRVTALKLKSLAQTAKIALRRSTEIKKKINGGSKPAESMSSRRYSRSLKTKKDSKTRKLQEDEKCKDLVEEKTLYVIKMKSGNETIESDQNQRCITDNYGSQDSSPRKLKFKRGQIFPGADTTSTSADRRSLKTKGSNFNNDKEQQHKPRSLKVVLKHQDIQKKRDSRVLFNNVIKETAKKLVKTRKSKVKALVGAFESVISLQERKSSVMFI